MRKIVVTAFGSAGDVLPYLTIGAELRRRGHEVTFIGNPYFAPVATESRLSFEAVGTCDGYQRFMADSALFHWRTSTWQGILAHFSDIIESVHNVIAQLPHPSQALLFAPWTRGDRANFWVSVEKFGIPWIGGVAAPSRMESRFDPPYPSRPLPPMIAPIGRTRYGLRLLYALRHAKIWARRTGSASQPRSSDPLLDQINRLRVKLDMPEADGAYGSRPAEPQRIVCMWPHWFSGAQPDWPAQSVLTGFPVSNLSCSNEPDTSGSDLPNAVLVFTTGSIACNQHAFFRAAVDACCMLERRAVLVTPHRDHIPSSLPDNVTYMAHAPFEELFKRASLVVHHGGVGTIALAIQAGVPQIVRPRIWEQFDLAYRVQRLGLGRMIADEQFSADQLAKIILSVLNSKSIARCSAYQALTHHESGIQRAADVIESCIGDPGASPHRALPGRVVANLPAS